MLKRLREFRFELMWLLLVGALSGIMLSETSAGTDGHEEDVSSGCPPGGCDCEPASRVMMMGDAQ